MNFLNPTFNGWDGKSYDGESRMGYIYRTAIKGCDEVRLIKVGAILTKTAA